MTQIFGLDFFFNAQQLEQREKFVKYLTVSDILSLADQINLNREGMTRILKSLLPVADLNRCCHILTSCGKLDYIFLITEKLTAASVMNSQEMQD